MHLSYKFQLKATIVLLGLALLLVLLSTSLGGQANAAFETYRPYLTVNAGSTYWASYTDYLAGDLTVDYTVSNSVMTEAEEVQITGAAANNGVTLLTAMPYYIGHIHNGANGSAILKYDVPAGVAFFRTNLTGTAMDLSGMSYSYPLNKANLLYAEHTAGNPAISVIDTASWTVVNKFTDYTYATGNSHRIQVSPDGNYIWQGAGGGTGVVRVTNAATGATVKEWAIGSHNGPTMSNWTKPDGHHYLFFPTGTGAAGVINVFDVEDQEHLGAIPVGETPNHMWDTSPDGNSLWGSVGSGTTSRVVEYDISNVHLGILPIVKSAEITIGGSLHALAVDLVRPRMYVGSSTMGLNVVDTSTNTVISTFTGGIGGTHNMTVSADGSHLLAGNSGTYGPLDSVFSPNIAQDGTRGPFLWGLNLDTLVVDKYVEFRDGGGTIIGAPSHQTYTSDGSTLLMSSTAAGYSGVYRLDPDTFAIEGFISIPGANPHSIGIAGGSGGLGGTTY